MLTSLVLTICIIEFFQPFIEKFIGGPVGITTIATAVSEEAGTLEEV
jgi:Holliday junction resolvasome RuvABC ATP-dependent DNA helicase subunit